jgi:hypothetical protein
MLIPCKTAPFDGLHVTPDVVIPNKAKTSKHTIK